MALVTSVLIPLHRAQSHGINLTARNLGSVQSSNLVGLVPEEELLMVGICSLCCRQGVTLSVVGAGDSGICLGLGWECAL